MYTISAGPTRVNHGGRWLGAVLVTLGSADLPAQTPSLTDTVALGAFVDGVIRAQMAELHIPSATVVIQ